MVSHIVYFDRPGINRAFCIKILKILIGMLNISGVNFFNLLVDVIN